MYCLSNLWYSKKNYVSDMSELLEFCSLDVFYQVFCNI